VCLSVTLCSPIKTAQARITEFSLSTATRTLFCDNFFLSPVRGFPSNEGIKERRFLKIRYFTAIGSSSTKMVAGRHTLAAYHTSTVSVGIDVGDLETTMNPQSTNFSDFSTIFGRGAHFKSKLRRNGLRSTKTTCTWYFRHTTFYNRLRFDLLGSKSSPYQGLKFGYYFKTYYHFIAHCALILHVAAPMLSRVTYVSFAQITCNFHGVRYLEASSS